MNPFEGMIRAAALNGRSFHALPYVPPVQKPGPVFIGGLDLGQAQDFTGLVIIEKTMQPDPEKPNRREPHVGVRHIHRWPPGTPYPHIVAEVRDLYSRPPLSRSILAIDRTGVGRAVFDLFAAAGIQASLRQLTIALGGSIPGQTVGKIDLVGAVQAMLSTRRLKIAPVLPLAETLARELELFRIKATAEQNQVFESWRERDHDDLVLALALAVWIAGQAEPNIR